MSDSMVGNRKFRTFNVIDDGSREALAIEVDTSLSSKRITRVLERIGLSKGFPKAIRSDNGPRGGRQNSHLRISQFGVQLGISKLGLSNQENPRRTGSLNGLIGFTEKQYWTPIYFSTLTRSDN
ncbi:hypothetical protein DYBT9275_01668 [Dyadobacter sp. CECT 9275]|uniref:Integrase catalytic domain-containing protein n=1 Tax=Dyadobacter helix TaxID=2822344 RepID=A0A916JA83_9BACT|nr:hypothetical protein DYBT9275_01668 [Dyadobacter sp. CECT 9275]